MIKMKQFKKFKESQKCIKMMNKVYIKNSLKKNLSFFRPQWKNKKFISHGQRKIYRLKKKNLLKKKCNNLLIKLKVFS